MTDTPAPMLNRQPVRMLVDAMSLMRGEIGGFPPEDAARLVNAGMATLDLEAPIAIEGIALAPHIAVRGQAVVRLRILKPFRGYHIDELAGFPQTDAERLIKSGFAARAEQASGVVGRTLEAARQALGRKSSTRDMGKLETKPL